MNTKYTLITGASSGIGLELAKICACNGQNLVLVARSQEILEELARELQEKYSVEVEVIPVDLSLPLGPEKLFNSIKEKGFVVNTLINNAGFGDHGLFASLQWEKQNAMIKLNIIALTQLTHLFLPDMLARQGGKILNVASTAAFQPGPLMAVYYATKAYVLSFSEALAEELDGSGVTVTALCPGPTLSGFQKSANLGDVPLLGLFRLPTSEQVASYAYQSLSIGRRVAVHGVLNKILTQSVRFIPRGIVVKLIGKLQSKRKIEKFQKFGDGV